MEKIKTSHYHQLSYTLQAMAFSGEVMRVCLWDECWSAADSCGQGVSFEEDLAPTLLPCCLLSAPPTLAHTLALIPWSLRA